MRKHLFYLIWLQCLVSYAQVIENPVFDRTDVSSLHIDKVVITSDTTFVYCTYSADANSWASISGDTYLISYPSKEKSKLMSCTGLPIIPEKREFLYDEKCDIIFYFPSIKGSSHFDFIESPDDKAFNIYGVDMRNQFEKQSTESELRRFSNMTSFYDSANDTLNTIQNKKAEIQAIMYLYGIKSDEYFNNSAWLCDIFDKYGYHQDAIDLMKTLIRQKGNTWMSNIWDDAIITRKLAEYYSHTKSYEKSIKLFKEAISKFESVNSNDEQYACVLGLLSDDYGACGDEHNSILYRHKSVEIRRKLGDSEKYLEDLGALIIGLDGNANYYERLEIAKKELANLPEFVDTTTYTYFEVLKSMSKSYVMIDDYETASKYCDKSLAILNLNKDENILRIAELIGLKSIYNYWLRNYDRAIALGEIAKNKFDSLQVKPNIYIDILNNLVSLYSNKYDYEKAIVFLKQISLYCEEKKNWLSLAESLQKTGVLYKYNGDLENADSYIRKALEIINSHDKAEEYLEMTINGEEIPHIHMLESILASLNGRIITIKISILGSLASIQKEKGKIEDAISIEKERGKICKENNNHQSYAVHLMSLSGYYKDNQQMEEAIISAEKSIELLKMINKFNYSSALLELATIYYEQGDVNKAISYAEEAIIVSKNYGDNKAIINDLFYLFYFNYLNKDYNKSEKAISEAINYIQKMITQDIIGMTTEQKQRLWKDSEYLFMAYPKLHNYIKGDSNLVAKCFDYTLFSKSLLIDSESMDNEKFTNRILIKWKDIQKELSDEEIAIEFLSTKGDSINNIYLSLIIDKDCKYPVLLPLFYESDFIEMKQTSKKNELEILGDLIWKPILKQYPKVKTIYFSPDGIIHIIPIEHSIVDEIGEMMENYNIFRLSSTKEIVYKKEKETNKNAILYGGLDYDMLAEESSSNANEKEYNLMRSINARGGFDPLSSTLEEVNEISNLLNNRNVLATLYTGVDGTEDSFKKLSGKDVNILHLSTHGMYVEPNVVEQKKKEFNFNFMELITNEKDPVREDIVLTHSFLVMSGGNKLIRWEAHGNGMSDGILTAFEISHVDLSNVDLVVLSACETGLGDIENSGVYGLQRGFKKAGVNTILMSLDKVDDEATKILMIEFYKNLMSGKTKHQSLKDAQKHLRYIDNGIYDKPEYWASFILLDGIN